ncbi:MAG: alpha/beta hydrolase, partial [Porticoccaceae bacterium]|nr:alpha/beta hydrolase [Porticoccaceae bacterium]
MQDLRYIEIETAPNPTAAVIWLHGLGANGHDFEPVVPELKLPEGLSVRFIFPHAPEMPVTINGGYVMPAWYDILEMNIDRKVDTKQLRASADAVEKLVEQQIEQGIDSRNIILAGFSQGGAVA